MKQFLFILSAGILLFGCATPQRAYRRGDMDLAIERSIKKLRKGHIRDKHILILEKAFAVINNEDYDRLQLLLDDNDPDKWPEVTDLASDIYYRQQQLKPYLPLYIKKEHRKARFRFYHVKDLMLKSKEKAAQVLYDKALADLEAARKGDKRAARSAYKKLKKIDHYYKNYKDVEQLKQEAHSLGTVYILMGMSNETDALLPARFKNTVLDMYGDLSDYWNKFDLNPNARDYDYKVIIRLANVDATPEQIIHDQFIEEKEIEESSQTDTIKTKTKVSAKVFVTEQRKAVTITSFVDVINNRTGERLISRRVTADGIFKHRSAHYQGDKRALSKETRRILGGHPVPFPSDEEMLILAAESVAPKIKRIIKRNLRRLQ